MGMEQFHTRERANEGRKLPLYTPDGKPTNDWILVRHAWSDAFVKAEDAAVRAAREIVMGMGEKPDPEAVAEVQRAARVKALSALVAGWSFEAECTPEAVAEFLAQAPQIADAIDKFAGDSKAFFGAESSS